MIYRPGMIGAHAVSGDCELAQFVPRYMLSALQLGVCVAPCGLNNLMPCRCPRTAVLEINPVDWMAAAIVHTMRAHPAPTPADGQDVGPRPVPVPVYNLVNVADGCPSFCALGRAMATALAQRQAELAASGISNSDLPPALMALTGTQFAAAVAAHPDCALTPLKDGTGSVFVS